MPGMKQRGKEQLMLFLLRHSRFFDEAWYRKQTGIADETDAAEHYYRGGWRQSDPSPRFRQEAYLAFREDVREAGVCPLAHWLFYRRNSGETYPGISDDRYARHAMIRGAKRVFFRFRYRNTIR